MEQNNLSLKTDALAKLDLLNGTLSKIVERLEDKSTCEPGSPANQESDVGFEDRHDASAVTPQVKYCNWKSFMNRFSEDEPIFAIEVLLSDVCLPQEMAEEQRLRRRFKVPGYEKIQTEVRMAPTGSNKFVERIRIRSGALLNVFSRLSEYSWGTMTPTFNRPFRYLIHFHETFRNELFRMESAMSPHIQAGETEFSPASGELEVLRCYIKFAEEELVPQTQTIRNVSPSTNIKIRYDDLECLFKPGDFIYMPPSTLKKAMKPLIEKAGFPNQGDTAHESSMQQRIWKLYGLETSKSSNEEENQGDATSNWLLARCYYLDYDGSSYGAIPWSFKIPSFPDEKEIRELEFYPLRFAPQAHDLLRESQRVGCLFLKAVETQHMSYDGITLVTDPMGYPLMDHEKSFSSNRQKQPVHLQGEIIVDFKESFNHDPWFKDEFADITPWSNTQLFASSETGREMIIVWSDSDRSNILHSYKESFFDMDMINKLGMNAFLKEDPYLSNSMLSKPKPSGNDLALLPRRVYAYALYERKFFPLDVRYCKTIISQADAFEQLQLPDAYKRMLKAAVESHLRRQEIETILGQQMIDHIKTQDFITGKGRGLCIMLHGEPGVGKTATSEAVAQFTKRPLFPISCGALTMNNYNIEEKLDSIFRLAYLWKCILLLDEADVFLTARTATGDSMQRNAIVSVFLRKVEYFNGILFLTTNRIGKLDQALTSRIHLILHYRRLNANQLEAIFKVNIQRLQEAEKQQQEASGEPRLFIIERDIMRFATDHCSSHPKGKGAWNGRQIRNAFLIASSLARHEAQQVNDKDFQPQLRYAHFQEVERMYKEYNDFRFRVLGGDDARKARLNEERDDDFENSPDEKGGHGDSHWKTAHTQRQRPIPYSINVVGVPSRTMSRNSTSSYQRFSALREPLTPAHQHGLNPPFTPDAGSESGQDDLMSHDHPTGAQFDVGHGLKG